MREILFRGKTKNRRDIAWIEGSLVRCISMFDKEPTLYIYRVDTEVDSRGCISDNYCGEEVIPETVGQFTGLFDKNGIAIFEGDIVQLDKDVKEMFDVKDGPIEYIGGCFLVGGNRGSTLASLHTLTDIYWTLRGVVIGNIHDNTELMGERSDNMLSETKPEEVKQ